jgi:hypothetical protein
MRAKSQLPSSHYLHLAGDLDAAMRRGAKPTADELAGWEFRGANTPAWSRLLGIKKFIKGFYRDRISGQLMGFNIPVRQNRIDEPWVAKPDDARPKRFGFYRVDPVDATATDNVFLNSVLLDYSRGGNHALDPTTTLRDYLVRLSDDLYLGKAYVALGPARLPVSYFVLERHRPHDYAR